MTVIIFDNYRDKGKSIRVEKIVDALEKAGKTECVTWRYDEIKEKQMPYDVEALVLSGSEASFNEENCEGQYYDEIKLVKTLEVPILGICFGHQLIGVAFGSRIHTLPDPVKDFQKVKILEPDEILHSWKEGEEIAVSQNHKDCLLNLPENFVLLAESESCKIEAIGHKTKPIFGIQAHIERATSGKPDGWQVFENFISRVVDKRTNRLGIRLPNPEEFRKVIEEAEWKHGILDCVYRQCIAEFRGLETSRLMEKDEIRIIKPFLLGWGVMGRVLGHVGVARVREKLQEISDEVEPFRKKNLLSLDLHQTRGKIVALFDEIKETGFTSKKGRQRKIGSTAASKILHLACLDLFVMWDSAIRSKYVKRRNDGIAYFEFLVGMKRMLKKGETVVRELQERHKNSPTRILDQYNWMITHS